MILRLYIKLRPIANSVAVPTIMHFGCILSIYVYRATAHDITHRNQYNVHFRMYLIAAINFSYLQEALQVPINHDYFVVQISAALNLCVLLYLKDTEERRGERDSEREKEREQKAHIGCNV